MRFEPKSDAEMAPKSIENRPRGSPWGRFWSFSKALGGVGNHVIYESGLGSRKGGPKWDLGSRTVSGLSWRRIRPSSFRYVSGNQSDQYYLIFIAVTVLITSSVNTEEPLWNIRGGLPEGLGFHEKPFGITFL